MNVVRAAMGALAVLWVSALGVEHAGAVSNPNGMVFRAIGIFQGESEEGKCKVPIASQAIADNANSICRDATEIAEVGGSASVFPTRMYPDIQSLFGNFCGGFLGLQNNMINQAINVYRVKVRYRMPGRGFPVLCRDYRKFILYIGGRIDPVNSTNPSPFGVPNQSFTQLLPIYSADLLNCLRDPLRGNVAAPITVVANIRAFGELDMGGRIKSNRVRYHLTLMPAGSMPGVPSGGIPPVGEPMRCAAPVE